MYAKHEDLFKLYMPTCISRSTCRLQSQEKTLGHINIHVDLNEMKTCRPMAGSGRQ